MGTLTVRNFDDDLKSELRVQAAERGRSMEEDVRQLLRTAIEKRRGKSRPRYANLAEAIRARFEPFGGVDLELPSRTPMREPLDFSGPEFER